MLYVLGATHRPTIISPDVSRGGPFRTTRALPPSERSADSKRSRASPRPRRRGGWSATACPAAGCQVETVQSEIRGPNGIRVRFVDPRRVMWERAITFSHFCGWEQGGSNEKGPNAGGVSKDGMGTGSLVVENKMSVFVYPST